MPKIDSGSPASPLDLISIEGNADTDSDHPEYRASVALHHATAPTREHLESLVAGVLGSLGVVTEWSATLNPSAGSRVEVVALFRAPDRREARERQRAALHAAQAVNGKVSRNDRCGKPDFVRNFRPAP